MENEFEQDDILIWAEPQDDGSRNAINHFIELKNEKLPQMLSFFGDQEQYWKARVFLELLWHYEKTALRVVK